MRALKGRSEESSLHRISRTRRHRPPHLEAGPIGALIAALASNDPVVSDRARALLIEDGNAAVPGLIAVLSDRNGRLRWEAVKALCSIKDPSAAPALVSALEDDMTEVRWMAAQGLIGLGKRGLVPLLQALIAHSDSVRLREGAHRILGAMNGEARSAGVMELIESLESTAPVATVPIAAYNALKTL